MLRIRSLLVICLLLCGVRTASAQVARVVLSGATANTGVFDASNQLAVVSRTVPAGYMDLYPAFDGSYRLPVIVVEGFDPMNKTLPPDIYAQLNVWGGLDTVRAAGRSVWIVNFGDGGGAIPANARLVSSAISQAANYGGLANAPVDIVGLSMGGIITRWAMASDEQNQGPSDGLVRLYVSGDSPQQGANANPHLQELILFENSAATLPVVRCDASVSMLYDNVRNYSSNACSLGPLPSPTSYVHATAAHDWFYSSLNALNGDGYAHKSRNVAVSNGNWNPLPYPAGTWLAACRTYANIIFRFQVCSQSYNSTAMDVGPGSLAGDFAPGQIRRSDFELDQNFVPSFIPTVSALDVRGGLSKFARTLIQSSPVNHSTITQATNEFMLEEVLGVSAMVNPKMIPDNSLANVSGLVVTGVYAGRFYCERPERAWGISVQSAVSVSVGDVVSVFGPMATQNAERQISASTVTVSGHTTAPAALTLTTATIGGGPNGPYTLGITGGVGLNNTGLLVRLTGRVSSMAGDGSFFVIDDGGVAGVRVMLTNLASIPAPPLGALVTVTGASSTSDTGSAIIATLRPRTTADVTVLAQP